MQTQETVKHGVMIVRLFGEFDSDTAPLIEERLAELTAGEGRCVVLDFTGVPFISSAGLRVLQKSQRAANARGGDIRLASLCPPVQTVLNQTGLAQMFKSYPDLDDALEDFTVVRLRGDLDAAAVRDAEILLRATENAGTIQLVVDMSQVRYMASAGLRLLQSHQMRLRSQGGDLRLAGVRPEVRNVFDLLGFTPLFRMYDTVPAALESFR